MADQSKLRDQRMLIYERDWDVLLVLDACRYDSFDRQYDSYLRGDLEKVRSRGSSTPHFLSETFDEPLEDVVYVSANPFISTGGETAPDFDAVEVFHEVVDIWQTETHPELGAVPPASLSNAVEEVVAEYPSKRVIGHYIQPHVPFVSEGEVQDHSAFVLRDPDPDGRIGQWRNELDNQLKFKLGKGRLWWLKRLLGLPPAEDMEVLLERGGQERLQEAYRKNLDAVLYSIHQLLRSIDGDVTVTADHGELLGERGHYGHKWGSSHPDLRNVPWFTVDLEASREVGAPSKDFKYMSAESTADSSEAVSERLRDLGYV